MTNVCISIPPWQIRILRLIFHFKSGYPDFFLIFRAGAYRPLYCLALVNDTGNGPWVCDGVYCWSQDHG